MTQLLFYPIRALSLIWLLLFTSLCAQAETTAIQPDGYIDGQGGEIATLAHLRWLSETPEAWDENWQQTQNIDAAESKLWNNGQGFRPIGDSTSQGYISGVSFSGSYNGNGYSISSLFIHNPQFSYIGMFGYLSRAQISNLSLKQIYVKGRDHVGGLAGYAYNSTLTNLRVTGEIEGNENIGGVLGSSRSDIHQAFSDVIVRGKSDLGGIIGEMMSAKSLSNSVSHGQLYSSNSGAGGLIGRARGYVINSYTTVALPPSKPSFGLYGIDHDIKSITNSYFDCEVGGIEGNNDDCYHFTTNTNSYGRPTTFLKSAANFSDWPQATSWEAGVWRIIDGQYPALTTQRLPLFDLPTDILPDKIAAEDQYFSLQTIASSNQVNQSIRYSLIGAPSWLSIDSNGLLAGVPTHNHTSQSSTIIVVAEQGTQRNYLPSFTLSVTPQNDAPIVEVPSQFSITHNKRVTLNLSDWVIDEEQGQFTYSINNGPSKAHLTLTPAGQATLVAKSPFVGFDSFSVWVEDGEHKIKQTVSYTIATSDTVSDGFWLVEEDTTQAIDFSIIAGGNTNPSVSIVAAPNHGAITAQSGRIFYYTPRANFSGEDNFTALIDGYLSNITLHVYSISDALTTQPTSITIEEDQVVDINLANAINDPDSTKLSFSKVSALKGELTKLSESVYRYHPEANYSGQDIIQFSAFDAERASVEANIDLTINSVNDAPTVQNIHTSNYKKFTIPLHKIISDIDSENITYRLLQYSSLGRASINGSTFWYTPGSVEGEDKVTIQVSDGETTSEFDINIRITTLPVEPADYDGYSGTITTLAELRWLTDTEEAWSKDWQLGADIDASLTRTWQLTDHDKQAHTTEMEGGFMPIGNGRTAFTGSFDGNNYTISNLYINQPYAIGIAFFDTLVNASIKDLHLTNAEIHGRIYVGGIASKSTNSVLDNVHYTGQVFGGHRVGGLISEDRGSTLSHSSVEGTISGLIYVGGAVGYQEKYTPKDSMLLPVESRVQANIIKADVVGVTSVGGLIGKSKESYVLDNHFGANIQGKDKVGGIIGEGYKMTLNRNSVEANILGSQYLGGIAGHLDVTNELNNNYSHGSITGESSIGGLIGKQKGSTTHILADSYTTMALYGNSNIGGLYASLSGDPHNSFYDCQLGFDDCADIYAKYTRDLKIPETFTIAGWSEADAWNQGAWLLVEGNYPKLRQHPVPLFNSPTEEIGQLTLDEGESVNQTINVIAVDNSFPLKYSLSDHAPNWLSIDSHSGELTGTPKDSDVGLTNNIIISVSQGPAHNQLPPFTVLVNDINNPPNVTEGTIVLNEGASKSIDLSTLVHDVDNRDKLTYAINLQPISGKANVTMTPAGIALYTTIDNNFNGSDEFSFTATDGHSDPVQGKVSVTVNNVNDIPQAKNGTLSLDEGGSKQLDLSQFVTDTDTSDLLQFHLEQASSNGKAIVSVTQEGLATYTSNDDDYFGQDTFYYSVTDGHSTPVVGIINVTITNLNDIPTTADGSMVLLEGGQQELNLTHLVSDSDSIDTLTFSLFKQPTSGKANVSISASGIATYTTNDDDFIGHDEFYYAVSDGHSDPVQGKVSVTVNNVNDIPQAKNGTLSLDEGGSKQLDLSQFVTDTDTNDLLQFHLEQASSNGKATVSVTQEGLATYTSNDDDYFGQDTFYYSVTDGHSTPVVGIINVTITNLNDIPTTTDGSMVLLEGGQQELNLTHLVSDSDSIDTLTFSLFKKPTSGKANVSISASGIATYTTNDDDFIGHDEFYYAVGDGHSDPVLGKVSVTVNNVNDIPQAKNGTLSLDEGGSKILNLHTLVNDDDASDLLTFTLENSANSGKADISITSDGIATYTLTDGNFNGQDKFSFRVNDQNNSTATAEVMVTVHAVNDTPIANDHQLTTNEDTAISVDIHSLFSDPDVDDAHLFSVSQPTSGQAIVELAGSVVTFIPIGEHNGYDSFLYSVTDSENQTDTALIQVRVDNNNDAPIISGSPQQQIFVGEHYDFIPDISDSDPDDEHWFSIDNQPSWTHFNQMTGQLSGTPKASDVGKSTDNITITVTDRGNLSASLDTFSIEVTQQQPEAVDDTISLYSNTSETYTLSVLDNDSHPTDLPLTLSSAITNDGQIRIINNQLILTMNHPFSHVELNYTIKDENEQTDSANVSLSINRSYEEDVPEVQVPADVSVYARSLFTRVQLTPPAAINQTGDVLPAKLLDPYAPLLPGRHDIRWLITDRDNNATVTTQIVDIHPMISLGKDATVGNDVEQYRVPFVLNGLSPSYPVTIPYQIFRHDNSSRSLIDSGVIAILDGTTAYLDLNVPNTDAVDPTSILSVKIDKTQTDQGHLLNISDRDEFTLYAQYESLSPTVESRVYQRGQQRHWVDRLSLITLKAIVKNPDDNANYQFNWQYHTDITPVLVEDGKLILDPSDLEEGIHKVTVFVHRSDTPTTVTEHEIYFEQTNLANLSPDNDSDGDLIPDQEEGYADEDLDGFPDYLDDLTSCHMMPAYANQEQRYLVEVEPGLCLHKGTTIANAMTSGLLVDPNNQEIAPDMGQNYIGGVYDFAISGLSHGGQLASIILPQKLPIPANAVYRKHLHNRWQDFADDINGLNQDPLLANGWVSSARGEAGYCPPPQSANTDGSPWYFGLNEGDWCVQLTIRDGGKNDADGLANGVILDPSGYATLNSDNQAPIALNDYYDVEQDDYAQYINVLSNDSDPNGNSLHITSVSIIEGLGHVDIQNNMLFFDSVNSVIGETIIQYTISDGLLPSTATATINVKRKKVRQSGTVYLFSTFVLIFIAFIRRNAK